MRCSSPRLRGRCRHEVTAEGAAGLPAPDPIRDPPIHSDTHPAASAWRVGDTIMLVQSNYIGITI